MDGNYSLWKNDTKAHGSLFSVLGVYSLPPLSIELLESENTGVS